MDKKKFRRGLVTVLTYAVVILVNYLVDLPEDIMDGMLLVLSMGVSTFLLLYFEYGLGEY